VLLLDGGRPHVSALGGRWEHPTICLAGALACVYAQ
jgi:hypothetical protein